MENYQQDYSVSTTLSMKNSIRRAFIEFCSVNHLKNSQVFEMMFIFYLQIHTNSKDFVLIQESANPRELMNNLVKKLLEIKNRLEEKSRNSVKLSEQANEVKFESDFK